MTSKKGYVSVIGMISVAVTLWSIPAYAQPRPGFHGPMGGMTGDGGGMMLPMLLRGANLTACECDFESRGFGQTRVRADDVLRQM